MKQRVAEMEMEAEKLRQLQAAAESAPSNASEETSGFNTETEEDKAAADSRSIYVGNVRYCCWSWNTNVILTLHSIG
jgi:polyadenylate-binding protein 2